MAGASPGTKETPRVLASGSIERAAQDGDVVVWEDFSGSCSLMMILDRRVGQAKRLAYATGGPGGDSCYAVDTVIGVGGRRAVWGYYTDCCNHAYGAVTTAAPGSGPPIFRATVSTIGHTEM